MIKYDLRYLLSTVGANEYSPKMFRDTKQKKSLKETKVVSFNGANIDSPRQEIKTYILLKQPVLY
jgi:hypothetical protein